ncbi:MAG: SRPBCC family protein [Planctomycetota bacterium]
MADIAVQTQIAAPPERVFELVADVPGAAERISGITQVELLTEGAVGLGTRWRETRGRMGTEELEVTRFEPPESFGTACESCGCRFDSVFRLEPIGDGTKVTLTVATEAMTLFAKLMLPVSKLMAGSMKRALAGDLADLKRAAEAQQPG